MTREIIGTLEQSPDEVLVVYRTRVFRDARDATPPTPFSVMTMGWTTEGWRARNPDFSGSGMGLSGFGPLPALPAKEQQ